MKKLVFTLFILLFAATSLAITVGGGGIRTGDGGVGVGGDGISTSKPTAVVVYDEGDALILEISDYALLEIDDKILLE